MKKNYSASNKNQPRHVGQRLLQPPYGNSQARKKKVSLIGSAITQECVSDHHEPPADSNNYLDKSEATGILSIIGTTKTGETLTADTSDIIDLDGAITFSFQWQKGSDNVTWSNIEGATNDKFVIPSDPSFAGQFIRLTAVSTDSYGGTTDLASTGSQVLKADAEATGILSVVGTTKTGETLTADTSDIIDLDGAITFSFQWQKGSDNVTWSNIEGATNDKFVIPSDPSFAGQFIRLTAVSTDSYGGTTDLASSSAQVSTPLLLPEFYLGTLNLTNQRGLGSISSAGFFRDYDPITNVANYWDIELKSGESIRIKGTRLEQDYDMAIWLFEGTITDPVTYFAGGSRKFIDQSDGNFIDFADDDTENPGPFADPLTNTYSASADTRLTAIVTNYASGRNDGGDGLFDYSIELIAAI